MRNSQKKGFAGYIVSGLFVVLLAALYIGLRDFPAMTLVEKYRTLCDAFTIPGLILILLGALLWVSDLGGFYGFGYVMNHAKNTLRHFIIPGNTGNTESFFDYTQRKKAEGHLTGYGFLFIVGGISMLISFVFMFLFYQNFQ